MSEMNDNNAMDQARAQMESISKMIARLDLDWDRLAELRETVADCAAELSDFRKAEARALCLTEEEREELAEMEDIADDCEDEDEAVQRIEEDPLDVCVRSEAEEYMILLCTGGPAVRITGNLSRGEASSARLEYQDWYTPWTEYRETNEAYLIRYADHFLGY